jgi:hypothetical protein
MNLQNASTKAWADYISKNSSGIGHRAWWFARDPGPAAQTRSPGGFEGLEQSLEAIGELIRTTGPVHAIWGFSQGACFAGMLIALLEEKNKANEFRRYLPQDQSTVMAGIIFSGFAARFDQYASIYALGIGIPTMHVMGENDLAVSVERSKAFVELCEDARVLIHAGGHDIPKSENDQKALRQFLKANVREMRRQLL